MVARLEWILETAQLVEYAAKRPDVTLTVVWLVLAHLRRQVIRRSNLRRGELVTGLETLGQAEVADFDFVVFRQENVHTLQVSMQNILAMEVLPTPLEPQKINACGMDSVSIKLLKIVKALS